MNLPLLLASLIFQGAISMVVIYIDRSAIVMLGSGVPLAAVLGKYWVEILISAGATVPGWILVTVVYNNLDKRIWPALLISGIALRIGNFLAVYLASRQYPSRNEFFGLALTIVAGIVSAI